MLTYKDYIYEVYRERSFSKAAKKLFISQPWLSSVVKKTENKLGVSLFDRSATPITLTEAGQYYIQQIERIMAIEQEMAYHFSRENTNRQVELCIGSSMFFCTYVLPRLMEDFCAEYPNAGIRFVEGDMCSLTEKLKNGALDLLLEAERPEGKEITTIPWATEEIILAVPAGYRINLMLKEYQYTFEEFVNRDKTSSKPAVPLEYFRNEKFLFLNKGNDSYERCMKICKRAGFEPTIGLYLSQMMTAYYLVCEGRGVAFLRSVIPQFVSSTDSVRFYRINDPLASRDLYLSYRSIPDHPLQQALVSFIGQKSGSLNPG